MASASKARAGAYRWVLTRTAFIKSWVASWMVQNLFGGIFVKNASENDSGARGGGDGGYCEGPAFIRFSFCLMTTVVCLSRPAVNGPFSLCVCVWCVCNLLLWQSR